MGHKPIAMTPVKALVAAGHSLRINPETFDVELGPMKGRALAIDVAEDVTAPPRRVVGVGGEVTVVPGKRTYQSNIRIVWNSESLPITSQPGDILKDFQQRLATWVEYSDTEDLDFSYEAREV